ncbi:MAG: homoserine kinase [Verrucomicrobia bacterium]|nr:homoserine kinase [Verrucomicrobiota bacterium]
MSAARDTVTVRVPGSTSNCGAGFDTLGLALTVYNRITLTRCPGEGSGAIEPETENDRRAQDLVEKTAAAFFREVSATGAARAWRYHIAGDVPPARGLGSSATIITGVLAGLDALHGTGVPRARLAALATAIEGNPDNVSPSVLGGFTVSRCDPASGAYLDTIRFAVPSTVAFVVVSPAVELLTKESRGALPRTLPFFDAARSVNSAAYLTAALVTGQFEKLRHAAGDFLHEPYRLPKIPGAREAIAAGVGAGALTGWLSGSGSSVLCVAWQAQAGAVAAAMRGAFQRTGVAAEARALAADNDGLQVEPLPPAAAR